jgi:Flp pilus assembly protein TadG
MQLEDRITASANLPAPYRARRRQCAQSRTGVAAVEAAVCIPFFVFLLLATIDCCCCIFLKQSLTVAAYEGARVAVVPGATTENVEAQVQLILDERGIKNAVIGIAPANFETLGFGDLVKVSVSAPAQVNSAVPLGFFSSTQAQAAVCLMIEKWPATNPESSDEEDDDDDDDDEDDD